VIALAAQARAVYHRLSMIGAANVPVSLASIASFATIAPPGR
jgi:hypothetical protein